MEQHDDSALFSLIQADYGLKKSARLADALKNVSMRNKIPSGKRTTGFPYMGWKRAYKKPAAGISWSRGF